MEAGRSISRAQTQQFLDKNGAQKEIALSFTDYPWRRASTEVPSNLIKWLFLPDFAKRPDATLLLCEYKGAGTSWLWELLIQQELRAWPGPVSFQSPFFANLLSDISPFHLRVITQKGLSEEI